MRHRKQQIADIYLEFANDYFDPPKKPDAKPDFEKALTFYSKAIEVAEGLEEYLSQRWLWEVCSVMHLQKSSTT